MTKKTLTKSKGTSITEFKYDETNKLVEIALPASKCHSKKLVFKYDNGGQRIVKELKDKCSVISKNIYVNGFYEIVNNAINKHISDGKYIFATKLDNDNDNLIFYSQNNIGSTTLLTDKNGSDIGQFLYTPFGETWVEEASTVDISHITRFFTNQQYDKESGLYYYNARYYDPHLGSFITPDPAMDQFNHYAYCAGNPIKYTDPTGLTMNENPYDNTTNNNNDDKNEESEETTKTSLENDSQLSYVKEQERRKAEILNPNKELDSSVKRYGNSKGAKMNFGTQDVVDTIKEFSEKYKKETGFDAFIGDLSLKDGVPSPRHRSADGKIYDHKGFSVDVKQGTKDGSRGTRYHKDATDDEVKLCDPKYSVTNTIKMIGIMKEVAENHNLELKYVIFADPEVYKDNSLSDVRFLTKSSLLDIHKNHIHFEFKSIYSK